MKTAVFLITVFLSLFLSRVNSSAQGEVMAPVPHPLGYVPAST